MEVFTNPAVLTIFGFVLVLLVLNTIEFGRPD